MTPGVPLATYGSPPMRFATAVLALLVCSQAHAGQVKEFLHRLWFGPPRQKIVPRPPEPPPAPRIVAVELIQGAKRVTATFEEKKP